MKDINKIAGINLLILLGYMVVNLSANMGTGHEWQLAFMVFAMLLVGAHAVMMFIVSMVYFVRKEESLGKAWLLGALIIAIVGFSACLGGTAL